ncbi:MAG TPA: glutathione S-transferase family protein [Myxococcota bacterium]|nr:glutathione S-transferase family protein [Myxococcota bacterium]
MKLYTFAGAPNPRRVHIFLAEKRIAVPFEHVDITKRANRTPEFLANVNPLGGVPVLELDDGTHIAESVAICRYFEALQPEPSLFGRTPETIGRIDMWNRRIELRFMQAVGLVWLHGSPFTAKVVKKQIPEMAELAREGVRDAFAFLDSELAQREFIAGDAYSMADILALTTFDFAGQLNQLHPEPEQKSLLRWHTEVSARPSAKA